MDKAKVEESEQKATEYSKKVTYYSLQQHSWLADFNWESFFFPEASRQAIDFPCPNRCPTLMVHDRITITRINADVLMYIICAQCWNTVLLYAGRFDTRLYFKLVL